jgi:HSP20 family protein
MLSLVKKQPRFGWGLMNLRDDIDRMFRDFHEDFDRESRWFPSVDIAEDQDKLVLSAELPGLKKDDVKINLEGKTLTIQGERKAQADNRNERYYRTERFYGKFNRSFTLNSEIDAEKIQADFKDGVLTINLPKSEAVKPRQITIN